MDRALFEEIRSVAVLEMEHSGYKAKIMEAERLKGDHVHALPPGMNLPVVPIACLPGAPESWVQGPGTYVVPVETEKGLWFDWRENGLETAVIPSVKGMNPITGEKLESLVMAQFRDKCPKHGKEFAHGRHCAECGYDWPPQNYVSHPNALWWDGFRQPDGTVRQFFFTDEDARDVASAMIGKENTVPAFGFGFFRTKADRTPPKSSPRGFLIGSGIPNIKSNDGNYACDSVPIINHIYTVNAVSYSTKAYNASGTLTSNKSTISCASASSAGGAVMDFASNDGFVQCCAPPTKMKSLCRSKGTGGGASAGGGQAMSFAPQPEATVIRQVANKDVAVGAGARINQTLDVDTTPLSEYLAEPQGLIRLYFVFTPQMREIIDKGGLRPLVNKKEGFMADKVAVG